MFTKYGYTTIGIVAAVSIIIFFLGLYQHNGIIKITLILLSLILLIFTLSFFRDPDRKSPGKDNIVVSPADGRVTKETECKYKQNEGENNIIFTGGFSVR